MLIRLLRRIKRRLKLMAGREIAIPVATERATEFHGTGYGGWAILAGSLSPSAIVYGFGVGEDASFDLSLIAQYGCQVHAFDPTPKSAAWVAQTIRNDKFIFEASALADHDGTLRLFMPRDATHVSASLAAGSRTKAENYFDAPCHRLKSIMARLGHTKLDVLKMDIEGAEYSALRDIFGHGDSIRPAQLLVEFHHWMLPFKVLDTKNAIKLLASAGYHPAWVSSSGHEVLFVRGG